MKEPLPQTVFDYVIVGSGFGGSVSAMRLAEMGYSVLVLERGKRFADQDFARSNWNIFKSLWLPALRCFGILQISSFKDVFVLHGAGVGGGSLGYANVLMPPSDAIFENPTWRHLAEWKQVLAPFYQTAQKMLGVSQNPRQWPADEVLREIAGQLHTLDTFTPTQVGVYFGSRKRQDQGQESPDPYFNGEGPARRVCDHCGGCMVGCRNNAKNTLVKNYLYFAEKWGARILAESEVIDIQPLGAAEADGARFELAYRKSTAWFSHPLKRLRARQVIVSAGPLGTLKLLFHCRDTSQSLEKISHKLGTMVRTNSESLVGSTARSSRVDYSQGIAITSLFYADAETTIEPVRYPAGSSLMRLLTAPLVETPGKGFNQFLRLVFQAFLHPLDFLRCQVFPGWAKHTTILLVMQTRDNRLRMHLGRSLHTLFRRGLVSENDSQQAIPSHIDVAHKAARQFAEKTEGVPAGSVMESLLDTALTAHILGGCPMGRDDKEGVVGLDCQVHHYPGLYVVDGSIMPANPGINPSLTIAALAEYAMSQIPAKEQHLR